MAYPSHRFAILFFAIVIAVWLGVMFLLMRQSALAPESTGTMLVVFEPGTDKDKAFAAITQSGATPIRETSFGFIWIVNGTEPNQSARLTQHGALGTYRELPISPVIAGCVAVADVKVAEAFGL